MTDATYLYLVTDARNYFRVLYGLPDSDIILIAYRILREQYGIYDRYLENTLALKPYGAAITIEHYAMDVFAAQTIYASVPIPPGTTEVVMSMQDDTLIIKC